MTTTTQPTAAAAAPSIADQRERLLIDIAQREAAIHTANGQHSAERWRLEKMAREAAGWDADSSRDYFRQAQVHAKAIDDSALELRNLADERERVWRGNHPALAKADAQADMAGRAQHRSEYLAGLARFRAALDQSPDLQASAAAFIELHRSTLTDPPAVAVALAAYRPGSLDRLAG